MLALADERVLDRIFCSRRDLGRSNSRWGEPPAALAGAHGLVGWRSRGHLGVGRRSAIAARFALIVFAVGAADTVVLVLVVLAASWAITEFSPRLVSQPGRRLR